MKRLFSSFLIIILAMLSIVTVAADPDADNEKRSSTDSSFTVYFLDVGEGDAAVICSGGYTLMIDGGDASNSSLIYSFLKKNDIDRIDYVVCTHPDADHSGGLSGALNYASAGVVFCSTPEDDTETFHDFQKILQKQKNRIIVPDAGDVFSLGEAKVTILSPERREEFGDNTSLVLRIEYGKTSFLFTGDAETEQEKKLIKSGMELESTVLKVGHHGSSSSTSDAFLNKISPKYAVISVGGDNQYGHPTQETLDRLQKKEVELYRTDMQGMITCSSDGEKVSFQTEKNGTIDTYTDAGGYKNAALKSEKAVEKEAAAAAAKQKAVEEVPVPAQDETPSGTQYIVNTNTKKFHYPSCRSVKQMKDKNKMDFTGSRDELIGMGYEPCQNCNP